MSYMYSCCRERTVITDESWNAELGNFGLQASSVRGYLENYGHTIVPLSEYLADGRDDASKLESAYRSGASAAPEHIALGLDISRPTWQSKINDAFESASVVVVRAASGQRKSTACYRWLMDREAISHTYLVNGIVSEDAPGIAAALRGLAKQGGDIYAYVEAGSDGGWIDLCTEVGRLSLPHLKLLVSVREDDAARAGYDASRIGATDIFLRFDKEEAAKLYECSGTALFPSFESAWKAFGGDGPLMEFTYSLNHEVTLHEKLEGQVASLRMRGSDAWLTFLYLASRAGEFGLSSSVSELKDASGCKDVQQMLAVLEDEMLLRSDEEREMVRPLHPHRSKLLSEIIAPLLYEDEEKLILSAAKCTRGDFGPILIPYLAGHAFSQRGLASLVQLSRQSWRCAAYALRVMVWKDARRFYLSTADVRKRMINKGLPALLGSMLAGAITEKSQSENWESVLGLFRDDVAREAFRSLVVELADRQADYQETERLLSELAGTLPPIDMIHDQASDAGLVLAYIGERGFGQLISRDSINRLAQIGTSESSEVDRILDLLVGYSSIGIDVGAEERKGILSAVCRRNGIVWIDPSELVARETLESDGGFYAEIPLECLGPSGTVRQVSAIVAPIIGGDAESRYSSDFDDLLSPNDVAMNAVCDLRRLFPDRGRYCVEYAGIKALTGGLEIPDCEKRIPEKNLRLNWTKLINKYYFGMCELDDNLAKNWRELGDSVRSAIDDSIKVMRESSNLTDAMLRGSKKTRGMLNRFGINAAKVKEELDQVNTNLPLCARDPYAFSTGQTKAFVMNTNSLDPGGSISSPAFGMKKDGGSILKTTRDFLSSLQNHFNTISDMMLYTVGQGNRPARIAISNIAQACAKAEASNSEFSKLSGGKQLVNESQREAMLQHAAHWNYLWCGKSTRKEATPFRQSPRVKTLQEMPQRLVKRLDAEADVISVSISDEDVVKVSYAATADIPFSEAAAHCVQDILKCDLGSDEHLLEYWMLCNGTVENVEVTYVSGDCSLLKQSYRFGSLVRHMDDSTAAEVVGPAEIVFDENNIDCLQEAVVSLQAALETGKRLLECVLEVNKAIVAHGSSRANPANEVWKGWHDIVSKELNKLLVQLNSILQMYPDDFRDCKTIINEFESVIHDVMDTEA